MIFKYNLDSSFLYKKQVRTEAFEKSIGIKTPNFLSQLEIILTCYVRLFGIITKVLFCNIYDQRHKKETNNK